MVTRREFVSLLGLLPVPAAEAMTGPPKRTFHVVEIAEIPTCRETHIETTGIVVYVNKEDDGDLHVKLAASADLTAGDALQAGAPFVVCEIIPELPVTLPRRPKVGDTLRVRGIRRYDDETAPGHDHWEIHPVTRATILVSVSPV